MAFRSSNLQLRLMLAGVPVALSFLIWPAPGRAYTAEEQQACSGDAFRLCSAEIPDVDRVTVCMVRNKSLLSPGCRVFFRPGPEAEPAGRPLNIGPGHHAGSHSHKSKRPAKKHHAT